MTEHRPIDRPLPVKLTVDDFLLLGEAGALVEYKRTELIDGIIVEVSPQHMAHDRAATTIFRLMYEALRGRPEFEVLVGTTTRLDRHQAPAPDLSVSLRAANAMALIAGKDLLLAVEVSVTTLRTDLYAKKRIYSAAGVPEYWVVDLNGGCVHRMIEPREDGYARTDRIMLGERLRSLTIADLEIGTEALL